MLKDRTRKAMVSSLSKGLQIFVFQKPYLVVIITLKTYLCIKKHKKKKKTQKTKQTAASSSLT